MLTANILQRVLFVRYHKQAGATGTAFTIEVDEKQYVDGIDGTDVLGVFYREGGESGLISTSPLTGAGLCAPIHG